MDIKKKNILKLSFKNFFNKFLLVSKVTKAYFLDFKYEDRGF